MKAILLVLVCAVLGLALQNYRLSERLARVEKATSQTTDTSEADLDRLRTRDALQEVVRGIMQSEAAHRQEKDGKGATRDQHDEERRGQ